MMLPVDLRDVSGTAELHDWFGYWPDFHDAEIVSLHLNRRGESSLRIHTWETTREVDEKGCYAQAKHVVVEFILENVSDLSLNGFNHQNVVFGLAIQKTASGFRLTLEECYGMAGTIEADGISLRLRPGRP